MRYKLKIEGMDENYSVEKERFKDEHVINEVQLAEIKEMLQPSDDNFTAVLYDKDGTEKWGLNRNEYEVLKESGNWFDSHKEALEKTITGLKKDEQNITKKQNAEEAKAHKK